MSESKKSIDEIREALIEMDKRTLQAEKDLKSLKQFIEQFHRIDENLKILKEYYLTDWLADRDKFYAKDLEEHHHSASEDAIWNVMQGIYVQKISMMKAIVNSIDD